MSYGINTGALSRGRSTRLRMIFALAAVAAALLAITIGAGSASAAFVANGYSLGASSTQAGSHPAITLSASNDALQANKNNDDLRTLEFELPAGMILNPKAVPTPCPTTTFNSGTCSSQTKVGTLSVTYRVGSTNYTVIGTVYSITPDADSLINFGFVVNASSKIQRFLFKSSKTTGLTKVRQGLDKDYGLTITIPEIPYKVKSNLGFSTDITISNIAITLAGRSGFTSYPVPSFVTAPTRCDAVNSAVKFLSYLDVTATRTSSYTPTGCNLVKLNPSFDIAATNTRAGQATGMSGTVYVPDADQDLAIQPSHVKRVAIDLAQGTTVNLATLNALALCSEAQLASDTCPVASKIGTASAAVTVLPGAMTGDIYLTSRDTIQFGYILRGARGTVATLRGNIEVGGESYTGGGLRVNLDTLPQAPWTSATMNFTSKLVNNPKTSCPNATAWAEINGYSGSANLIGTFFAQTGCPVDTTITSAKPAVTKSRTPIVTFTAAPADGATFECQVDYSGYTPCATPFTIPTLADGNHTFGVRAVRDGVTDTSPAQWAFTVDATPPPINITSPTVDQVVTQDQVEVIFTTEPGATNLCRLEDTSLETCTSPQLFTGLADGEHTLTFYTRDAIGNYKITTRNFSTVTAKAPIVNITSPTQNSTTPLTAVKPVFTYSSPSGVPITSVICTVFYIYYEDVEEGVDYDYEYRSPRPCTSGVSEINLDENDKYRLQIEVTDANGEVGTANVKFQAGIRPPMAPRIADEDQIGEGRITHRDPGFQLEATTVTWPNTTYECSLEPLGSAPVWLPCGSPTDLPRFKKSTPLADGAWDLKIRARSGDVIGFANGFDFTVGPWSATYAMTPSTSAAGAHPDLDVQITPDKAGQFRSFDMTLPKGLIGSLTAFPKCPQANIATADCAIETELGDVEVEYQIAGLANLRPTDGSVFFTGPQAAGDVAGMVIKVNSPVRPFADVIIPLRIQLVNNSQQMRIFSDAIPTVVGDVGDPTKFTNFWVNDFIMHVRGSQGSSYPLLTNPSSCAASEFTAVFGDKNGNKTPAATIPFQATNCAALPFNPTITQSFTSTTAGDLAGISANVSIPQNNSSFRTLRVAEPAAFGPSFPSFGAVADQCSAAAAPTGSSVFNPSLCPESAKVGEMTIISPLLDVPLQGTVYLINKSPLPWLGVALDGVGVSVRLVGVTSLPQVDPSCDPSTSDTGECPSQIVVTFGNLPDLQATNISFSINGPDRTGVGGTTLPGKILVIATPSDPTCVPSDVARTTFTPNSGTPAVTASQAIDFSGCAAR
jgi:hypothetical protein